MSKRKAVEAFQPEEEESAGSGGDDAPRHQNSNNIISDITSRSDPRSQEIVLEEEILLHEAALKALLDRQEDLELEAQHSDERIHDLVTKIRDLENQEVQLQTSKEKHLVLEREVQESLSKSKERLSKLLADNPEAVDDETEDEDIVDEGNNENHAYPVLKEELLTSSSRGHGEPITTRPSGGRGSDSTMPVLPSESPQRLSVKIPSAADTKNLVLKLADNGKGAMWLMGVTSPLLERIMKFSMEEAIAGDVLSDKDSALSYNSNHRRELLWNSSLDLLLLSRRKRQGSSLSPKGQDNETRLESQDNSLAQLDPNVSLCPYELSGECADDFCPYQHTSKQSPALPRERLVLPPLKLPTEGLHDAPNKKYLTVTNSEREETVKDLSVLEQPGMKSSGSPPGEYENDTEMQEPPSIDKESHEDFQSDFITLPAANESDNEVDVDDKDEVDQEGGGPLLSPFSKDMNERKQVHFWWDERPATLDTPSHTSFPEWMDHTIGFRIDQDKDELVYLHSIPKCSIDWVVFLGRSVDTLRVAVHAGRWDVFRAVCKIAQSKEIKLSKSQTGSMRDLNIIPFRASILRHITYPQFEKSISHQDSFTASFSVQVSLYLLSTFLSSMHSTLQHSRDGKVSSDYQTYLEWSHVEQFASCIVMHNKKLLQKYWRGERSSVVEDFKAELDRVSSVDTNGNPDILDTKDMDRRRFNVFRSNVSWAMLCCSIYDFDPEMVEEEVLRPCWSLLKKFLDTCKDRISDVPRGIIMMGYLLMACFQKIMDLVPNGSSSLSPSLTATLTNVDTAVYRMLAELSDRASDVPLVEVLLAPLYGATIASACFLRQYATVQQRLEALLGAQDNPRMKKSLKPRLPAMPLTRYADLLWSQLTHLRMSLPSASPSLHDISEVSLTSEEEQDIRQLTVRIESLGVHLNHVKLEGDTTLQKHKRLRVAFIDSIFDKESQSNGVEIELKYRRAFVETDSMCRPINSNNLRSEIPRSLLLAGPSLKAISFTQCHLESLPFSFGKYLINLMVSELPAPLICLCRCQID